MSRSKLILIALIAITFVATKGPCVCLSGCAGEHCWDSPLLTNCYPYQCKCKTKHIYQCNGVRDSNAVDIGICSECIWRSCAEDYCSIDKADVAEVTTDQTALSS